MNQQERKAWLSSLSDAELDRMTAALNAHWPHARGRPEDAIAYTAFMAGWKAAKEDNDSPTG
jgi:ribosome modulation factor